MPISQLKGDPYKLDSRQIIRDTSEQVHTADLTPHSDKEWSTFPGDGHRMSNVEVRFFLRDDLGIFPHARVKLFPVVHLEYSLEGLILKRKLWYFGHLMQSANSLEKTLMLGKIEGRRRRGQQKRRWLDGINNGHEFEQAPGDGEAWHAAVHGVTKSQTQLTNWITT